tara:strand:+ start:1572 stop:1991 length:420 start_codon:yes stop_codon:yes gene_type:complete
MSNVTALKRPTAERPIALLLSQLDALTSKKKQCQAQLKSIEAEMAQIHSEIQDYMERSDLKEVSSQQGGKAVMNTKTIYAFESPETKNDFFKFAFENEYYQLLYQRPGQKACEELITEGMTIPGIKTVEKIEIQYKPQR